MGEIEDPEQSEDQAEPCSEQKITRGVGDAIQEEIDIYIWFQETPQYLDKNKAPRSALRGPIFHPMMLQYAAVTKDAAQRRSWTFYEAINDA